MRVFAVEEGCYFRLVGRFRDASYYELVEGQEAGQVGALIWTGRV